MQQHVLPYNLLKSNPSLSPFTAPGTPSDPNFQRSHRFTQHRLSVLVQSPLRNSTLYHHVLGKNELGELRVLSPLFAHEPLLSLPMTRFHPEFTWITTPTPTPVPEPSFSPCRILTLTKTLTQAMKTGAVFQLPPTRPGVPGGLGLG